ncbi:MAG: proprotein convertase P-domain-containing protein, partial [Phycisphaerales bacterium]|nr:proprotein convertase P-domain-containing protein [Phycisphaerales bacterium]
RLEALPLDTTEARFPGPVPDVLPVTLTSQVVVRAADAAPLRAALPGATVNALPGVAGFWIVDLPDVSAAVNGVSTLLAAGFDESALVIDEPMMQRGVDPGEDIDPLYMDQWHFENTIDPLYDCNADGAWALGFTGAGVLAGIVESGGGWEAVHPDLAGNYEAAASNTSTQANQHGTSVAGIVGAVGFNNEGVRGLAYNARISALDIGSNSTTRAAAIAFMNDAHDLKNNSWGPSDNGTVFHLAAAEKQALEDSALLGRGGLGTIQCWAAGNGSTNDRIDYDGFANSRYTIACGWIGDLDTRSHFSATYGNETGSAMMVVAHSAGNVRGITTTNRGIIDYTSNFGGSSASCPVLTGTVALMLEANPALTWRDVQHILVETARQNDPANPGWEMNAAGHLVSYDYGFGAVETREAVMAAALWAGVPAATSIATTDTVELPVPSNDPTGVTRVIHVDEDLVLEHVEVTLNITHAYRGDLAITLTAPSGTESVFAIARNDSGDNYTDFTFMTVRSWGESSQGDWTLKIADLADPDTGTWHDWTLTVHGTVAPFDCPGDVTGDLLVNFDDLNELLDHWGEPVPPGTPGDLDGSGMVNFADLEI